MTFPGLCATCAHVKVIDTRKGSRFYLCTLSEVDPRFRKYPPLPVLQCIGWREASEAEREEHASSTEDLPR